MEPVIIFDYTQISIAILLTLLCCILILTKSPTSMIVFKWMLLNVQLSMLCESFFWTVLFVPIIDFNSIIFVYPRGVLWMLFRMTVPIQWGVSTAFHAVAMNAVASGILYRYWLVLPLSGRRIHPFFFLGAVISIYIYGILFLAPCSYASFIDIDPSELENVNMTFPDGSVTIGGIYAIIWAISQAQIAIASLPIMGFIITHSHFILKRSAASDRTRNLHKEAIRGLIVQGIAMTSCTTVPMAVLAAAIMLPNDHYLIPFLDSLKLPCLAYFGMKAFNCALAIIFTTTPYRKWCLQIVRCGKAPENAVVSLLSTSQQSSSGLRN